MNITLSPKKRFIENKKQADDHAELVRKESFHTALEAALAQMTMNLPHGDNPAKSWDNACRIQGAKTFIEFLLNLSEIEKPKTQPNSSNLDHNV